MQNQRLQTNVLKPIGDQAINLKISRNLLFSIIFSLVIHALLLYFMVPKWLPDQAAKQPVTLHINLAQAKPKVVAEATPTIPQPQPEPPQPPQEDKKLEKPPKPKVITQKSPLKQKPIFSVPEDIAKPVPEPAPTPSSEPEIKPEPANEPTDMASYIKAQQAKRNSGDAEIFRQNAEASAREQVPTEDEKREARIKNNLKVGTNGIFEITGLSLNHATFSFKGWTNDYSNARREFFEVEANSGEDIRLLVVKKMISLIRQHYQGNFNWESHRLNRTVVKSARLEDNAELEDFLMMEFFGTHYKNKL